ncbi:MAG TPA: cytochrome d ubiquinol oxidase subunit II [Thermoleophilaceae bacterium]|jgi:cytochrome d ubiquinol oxidase subunit II
MSDVVAAVLLTGATLYAVFGGADFGVGFWDLTAGGAERGEEPRALIDHAIAPVWEANHVWLIFCLVVLWTGFPDAFAAVMSTLYVPLLAAAVGIVLRGSGFAFRKVIEHLAGRRLFGAIFAVASVMTPFFMGTVVGAIVSGRVPADGNGDRWSSWTGLTSILVGVMFVASCAYLAAVFLVVDARHNDREHLALYFERRALGAGVVTGALAVAGVFVLHAHARYVFDGLVDEGLPFVIVSVLSGAAAVVLMLRGARRGVRLLAVLAVAAVVCGGGVAQYPYLLPKSLTVADAAAPHDTLVWLLVVFGLAAAIVAPALALLYSLHQRSLLDE